MSLDSSDSALVPVYSDYLVFVDESGDHNLDNLEGHQYPLFVLSFCIISKNDYLKVVLPALQELKLKYWGHEAVVLHEHDIRKDKEAFLFFRGKKSLKSKFLNDLTSLMGSLPYQIIAVIIDKKKLKQKYPNTWNPYDTALYLGLERLDIFLKQHNQESRKLFVQFESRGKKEDSDLELEFRRIVTNSSMWGWRKQDFKTINYEPLFIKKECNTTGLQIADLTARPLGINYLQPQHDNRAVKVLYDSQKILDCKLFP